MEYAHYKCKLLLLLYMHTGRKAKTNYFSSRIADQKYNPKEAWRSINNLLGKQNKNSKVNELKAGGEYFK